MTVIFSKDGVELANVANAGVSNLDPNARSGNPRHDARSGKFGTGKTEKQQAAAPPPNTDPKEFARLLDAVRSAARTLGTIDEKTITEFVHGRAAAPDQVDIARFLNMVKEQRKTDLTDAIDQILGGNNQKLVKLTASRGNLKKLVSGATPDDLAEVMHRLESMGHPKDKVDRFFAARIPTHQDVMAKRDKIAASDTNWTLPYEPELDEDLAEYHFPTPQPDSVELVEKIVQNLPAPNIQIDVHVPPQGGRRTIIPKRNPDTGLIESIEEVEDAS